MNQHYSEEEVIARIAELTRPRLMAFIEAELVMPLHTESGQVYRQIDIARLELLCELSDHFDIDEDALCMILSLIDQLHSVRSDLRRILDAVTAEPPEVRARLEQRFRSGQADIG